MEVWPHMLCDKSAGGQMPHPPSCDLFLRLVSVWKVLCNRYERQLEFNNYLICDLHMDFPILQEKLS